MTSTLILVIYHTHVCSLILNYNSVLIIPAILLLSTKAIKLALDEDRGPLLMVWLLLPRNVNASVQLGASIVLV